MKAVARCGAPTASGSCRRRVGQQGGPCYLHPPFTVTRERGTVHVEVAHAYVIVDFGRGDLPKLSLTERSALELARQIQRACTQLEGEPT